MAHPQRACKVQIWSNLCAHAYEINMSCVSRCVSSERTCSRVTAKLTPTSWLACVQCGSRASGACAAAHCVAIVDLSAASALLRVACVCPCSAAIQRFYRENGCKRRKPAAAPRHTCSALSRCPARSWASASCSASSPSAFGLSAVLRGCNPTAHARRTSWGRSKHGRQGGNELSVGPRGKELRERLAVLTPGARN